MKLLNSVVGLTITDNNYIVHKKFLKKLILELTTRFNRRYKIHVIPNV